MIILPLRALRVSLSFPSFSFVKGECRFPLKLWMLGMAMEYFTFSFFHGDVHSWSCLRPKCFDSFRFIWDAAGILSVQFWLPVFGAPYLKWQCREHPILFSLFLEEIVISHQRLLCSGGQRSFWPISSSEIFLDSCCPCSRPTRWSRPKPFLQDLILNFCWTRDEIHDPDGKMIFVRWWLECGSSFPMHQSWPGGCNRATWPCYFFFLFFLFLFFLGSLFLSLSFPLPCSCPPLWGGARPKQISVPPSLVAKCFDPSPALCGVFVFLSYYFALRLLNFFFPLDFESRPEMRASLGKSAWGCPCPLGIAEMLFLEVLPIFFLSYFFFPPPLTRS